MHGGYRIRPIRDIDEWDDCFDAVAHPHLPQFYALGEAKQRAEHWHVKRYIFEHCATPFAIAQVLEKRIAGLRVASRINRGPLFIEESPSYEDRENAFRLIRDSWRILRGGPLFISPALALAEENRSLLLDLGFKDRNTAKWRSSIVDLTQKEDEIRKRLASNWRNHLKLAERTGVELRTSNAEEDCEWLFDKHVEDMREKKYKGPSKPLLQALCAARRSSVLVLQALIDKSPQAGILLVHCRQKAEYHVGWFGPNGRKFNCGNFLLWNAVLEMKKAGCKYLDVGSYSCNEKFGHFKQGMRGQEYQLVGEWLCY